MNDKETRMADYELLKKGEVIRIFQPIPKNYKFIFMYAKRSIWRKFKNLFK
jgi:hypothetical protein